MKEKSEPAKEGDLYQVVLVVFKHFQMSKQFQIHVWYIYLHLVDYL